MADRLKETSRFAGWRYAVWVFVKAQLSSYVASLVDFLVYLFVWGGSILLNTWGTFALTEWLTGMRWVDGLLGHYINDVFILSKIIVAVLVAFFWNYHLQRIFVYRNHNFRKFIRQYFRD